MEISKLKLLVVDDEPNAILALRNLISQIPECKIIAEAQNVSQAQALLADIQPDLAFVDVELPDGNGFDLVSEIRQRHNHCGIIFVTAYDHYALQAIRQSALDYLLKPVSLTELRNAIQRYSGQKSGNDIRLKLEKLQQFLHEGHKLKFNNRDGFILLDPQDIVYCEASGSYVELHLVNGRAEVVSMNLGNLEDILSGYGFFRISRSTLINIAFLSKVNRKQKICTLSVNDIPCQLSISSDRISKLEDRLLM